MKQSFKYKRWFKNLYTIMKNLLNQSRNKYKQDIICIKNYEELISYIFHLPLETTQELTQDSGLYKPLTHSSAIVLRAMLFQIQACIYKTTNKRSRSKKTYAGDTISQKSIPLRVSCSYRKGLVYWMSVLGIMDD
jgi:hypothetical protein